MPSRRKKIGVPSPRGQDDIYISKSDGKVKLFAKFNNKWYTTELSRLGAFEVVNSNKSAADGIIVCDKGNKGRIVPNITANADKGLSIKSKSGKTGVLIKEDAGVLKVRNSKDSSDANMEAKTVTLSSTSTGTSGNIGYNQTNGNYIGEGHGFNVQNATIVNVNFTATCDPDGTGSSNIVVTSGANKNIKVGQTVKATNGTPKSGKVPYVGAIAESGGTGTGVTSFTLYRDGAAVNAAHADAETWTFSPNHNVIFGALGQHDESAIIFSTHSVNPWKAGLSYNRGTVDGSGDFENTSAPFCIAQVSGLFRLAKEQFTLDTTGALELFGTSSSLKFSYDASNYGIIDVASDGHVEIESVGTDADMTLNAAADIELNADGGDISLKDALTTMAQFVIGRLTIHKDATSFARIDVAGNGATIISTTDGTAADADLTLDAGGDITLDSGTGLFIAKNAGTEFSVANSAYAGMILGYTTVGIDAADANYILTATMSAINDALKVKFVAPPSGVVEIFAQIYFDASRRFPVLGLSDQDASTGYRAISFPNATDVTNEHIQAVPPTASGDSVLRPHWVVTGLTPGTAYEWWLGAKTTFGLGGILRWGGNVTNEYPPFIMKATALPAAVTDFAVYG